MQITVHRLICWVSWHREQIFMGKPWRYDVSDRHYNEKLLMDTGDRREPLWNLIQQNNSERNRTETQTSSQIMWSQNRPHYETNVNRKNEQLTGSPQEIQSKIRIMATKEIQPTEQEK